jgi:hypothetical protein
MLTKTSPLCKTSTKKQPEKLTLGGRRISASMGIFDYIFQILFFCSFFLQNLIIFANTKTLKQLNQFLYIK